MNNIILISNIVAMVVLLFLLPFDLYAIYGRKVIK